MRPALVDNLTLDAVQRILGQVIAEYYDDGEEMIKEDVIAFDNLLNAILFSDEVVYIESFMPEDEDARRFGDYFPRFTQYRMGIVAYRTIIKDINDEFALKYDMDIKNTPAFFSFEFMKPHLQLPAINRTEYGSLVYHTISANLGTDLVLFPSRATFQRRLINDFAKELKLSAFENPYYIDYDSPLFISWFAQNYKEPSKFIDAAYELREEAEFVEIREILNNVRESMGKYNLGTFFQRRLEAKAIARSMDDLAKKYSVTTESGRAKRNLTLVSNLKAVNQGFIPAPGMNNNENFADIDISLDDPAIYEVRPRAEHLVHLGNLHMDKKELDKLGTIYDYITSDLVLPDSKEAKIFNEAMLIKTFRENKIEARAIYEKIVGENRISAMELINHEDVTLSPETVKFLQEIKKD